MEDDLTVWKNIRNGDTRALKVLHDRYYFQMYFYATKLYHNQSGLEEAVSDCFIKMWKKRGDIVIEHSVKSYLYMMLRNGLIDVARKKRNITEVEYSSIPEIPDVERQYELDNYARLYIAMEKLPEQRRRILELAVFELNSYAQIAEKLGISVNTVKTQLGRAYRFLKEELNSKYMYLLFVFLRK